MNLYGEFFLLYVSRFARFILVETDTKNWPQRLKQKKKQETTNWIKIVMARGQERTLDHQNNRLQHVHTPV